MPEPNEDTQVQPDPIKRHDIINLLQQGVNTDDLASKIGTDQRFSVNPIETYYQQFPNLKNDPNFPSFYSQSKDLADYYNNNLWKNNNDTQAEKNELPWNRGKNANAVVALSPTSSLTTVSGRQIASPQEWAWSTGEYLWKNPATGKDESHEITWWDKFGAMVVNPMTSSVLNPIFGDHDLTAFTAFP